MRDSKSGALPAALLAQTPLFRGFTAQEAATLLPLLAPQARSWPKGGVLLAAGDEADELGIILSGEAEAVKYTRAGGQFTVGRLGAGRVFGDVLAVGTAKSPVTVTALAPVQALMLPGPRLFAPSAAPQLQSRLLANLVGVLSDKYFALDARIDLLLIRGLRRKLAAYLLSAQQAAGAAPGSPFTIPYNRAQLAAYLGCERSALSRELSAMARAGLVETARSRFCILDAERMKLLL